MIFIHKGNRPSGLARPAPTAPPESVSRSSQATSKSAAGRVLRVLIGMGMLALPVWFLTPGLWTVTSTQAIVNAEVITLTSPIEGMVTLPPPPLGQFVSEGSVLLQIDAPEPSRQNLEELEAEAATVAARLAAFQARQARTEALKLELECSFKKYQESMTRKLMHELDEARAKAQAAEAMFQQRKSEESEEIAIARRAMASQRELTQARSTSEIALRNFERARSAVERLSDQIESMKAGVFTGPGDSRNDVPYSRQKIDELRVQQLDDDVHIREEEAKLVQVRRRIKAESARVQQKTSYQLKAPCDGIVWRHYVMKDSSIGYQTKLVQLLVASSVFVDASLPEKFADDVRPGDKVVVRPIGSAAEAPGTVRCLIGEDARVKDDTLAAMTQEVGRRELHVIVDLDQGLSGSLDFNQCFVGRRVEVRFPGITRSVLGIR